MAASAEEEKEGSNIEQKDVAELVSKLDAKYNVKVTAQDKGQKSNRCLTEGSDKGTISSVIQSTNQSRVPGSRPRTNAHTKGKDTRLNPEHKLERKR